MARKCIKCGQELKEGAEFCPECGTKQPKMVKCPKCGKEYEEGTTFCSECGEKLEGEHPMRSSTPAAEQDFDAAADRLNKVTGGKGKLVTIMGGIIAVLLVVVLLMAFGGRGGSDSSTKGNSDTVAVKSEEMIDDYIRDQGTAEKKYKGKIITISGKVMAKGQFKNSSHYKIVLSHKNVAGKDYSTVIDIPPEKVSELNKLKTGDFVNAKGTCVGVVKQESPTDISIQVQAEKINE